MLLHLGLSVTGVIGHGGNNQKHSHLKQRMNRSSTEQELHHQSKLIKMIQNLVDLQVSFTKHYFYI